MRSMIIYILTLIVLLSGYVGFDLDTMDKETLEVIKDTLALEDINLWPGFDYKSYPMDVNYGKVEYRFDKGEIIMQQPAINPALTAAWDDGQPVLKLISLEDFRRLYDLGNMSLEDTKKIYKTLIVHEAFHCFQAEKGGGIINLQDYNNSDLFEGFKKFKVFQNTLDLDENYQKLWLKEYKSLISLEEGGNINSWLEAKESKENYERNLLKEDFAFYKNICLNQELLEGTARYVENKLGKILKIQNNDEEITTFINGEEKFYVSGAIKSSILDLRLESWKYINFDGSVSLDDLILSSL